MLEIPHSVFLLLRCQRYTHRPWKRVHDEQHDNEPLYSVRHDCTDICVRFQRHTIEYLCRTKIVQVMI